MRGGIDHDAREPRMKAALEEGDIAPVVKVDGDRNRSLLNHLDERPRDDIAIEIPLHVILMQVNDNGRTHFGGRMDNPRRRFEVEGVDCHHRVALFVGLLEHVSHRRVHMQ